MNRSATLLLSVLALLTILFFLVFKLVKVPDVNWSETYKPDKKDVGDSWLLAQCLKENFGSSNYKLIQSDSLDYLTDNTNTLLVIIADRIGFNENLKTELDSFISAGNEALLIANSFDYDFEEDSEFKINTYSANDTMCSISWCDSTQYDYQHYWRNLEKTTFNKFYYFWTRENDNSAQSRHLAYIKDSLPIFTYYPINNERLYLHSVPKLFTNIAGFQEYYLDNFNKTFSIFKSKNVILHKFINKNIYSGKNEASLLKYIMSQPALKAAYLLLILLCLLYVAFSAKRKQKAIPVLEENKNTSLDYVYTMSELFEAQGQNEKLVPHMGKIFYHNIKKKYFLEPNHPEFVELLTKKSKVPQKAIDSIITKIRSAKNYAFTDDQLIKLYNEIHTFHKNCK